MNTTHTPEDYTINPLEALEINAKATQGKWFTRQRPWESEILLNEKIRIASTFTDSEHPGEDAANAHAIAYNHNSMPGILRRLMEAEDTILRWYVGPISGHFEAMNELEALAERIKAGRSAQS